MPRIRQPKDWKRSSGRSGRFFGAGVFVEANLF
jgi:hypothetical protein